LSAHVSCILLQLPLSRVHRLEALAKRAQRLVQNTNDLFGFVLNRNGLEIGRVLSCLVKGGKLRNVFEFILILRIWKEVVHDNANAFHILLLHLFVLVDIAVKAQHVEEHVDREYFLA
jgi:hypothetical protein